MKKNMKIYLLISVVAVSLAITSVVYANTSVPTKVISQLFENAHQKISQSPKDAILVHGNGFQIALKDFILYKNNVELTSKLNGQSFTLTDDQLINNMINQQLLINLAKKSGITVTSQEVTDFINKNKAPLYDSNDTGANKDMVKAIMDQRIKQSGLTSDEFWNSPEVRKSYEDALIIQKLYQKFIGDGTIKNMNDFNSIQEKLLQQNQGTFTIDKTYLK